MAINENEVSDKIRDNITYGLNVCYPFKCDGYYNGFLIEKKNVLVNCDKAIAQSIIYLKKFELTGGLCTVYNTIFSYPHTVMITDDFIISLYETNFKKLKSILDDDVLFINGKSKSNKLTMANIIQPCNPTRRLERLSSCITRCNFDLTSKSDVKYIRSLFTTTHSISVGGIMKNEINKYNVEKVFEKEWVPIFGNVLSLTELVNLFLIDIRQVSDIDESKSKISFNEDTILILNLPKYRNFWKKYNRVTSVDNYSDILSVKYTLKPIDEIRKMGEYYTPLSIVQLHNKILEKHIVNLNDFKIYDPAAGIGNLLEYFNLDNFDSISDKGEKYNKVFLSTIDQRDVDLCKDKFSYTNVWKMDFLNLNYSEFHPLLKKLLLTSKHNWLFDINPPYISPTGLSRVNMSSNISFRKIKIEYDIGGVSEIGAQFLINILDMIKYYNLKNVYISLFIPVKWFQLYKYQKFVKLWTKYFKFIDGLVFDGDRYSKAEGYWQAGYMLWKFNDSDIDLSNSPQTITLDYYDKKDVMTGEKVKIELGDNRIILRDYLKELDSSVIINDSSIERPCLSNTFKFKKDPSTDKIIMSYNYKNTVGFMWRPISLSEQGRQYILSWSDCMAPIYLETIEEYLSSYSAHVLIKLSNINFGCMLKKPDINNNLYNVFKKESVIFSLFSIDNHTSSVFINETDKFLEVRNNMFILSPDDVMSIEGLSDKLYNDCVNSEHSSSILSWLDTNYNYLSPDAKEIFEMGKNLFIQSLQTRKVGQCIIKYNDIRVKTTFYPQLLERYDAGWFQITRDIIYGNNIKLKELYSEFLKKYNSFRLRLKDISNNLKYV